MKSELQSADIVFLIDGSDGMKVNAEQIWDFVRWFVEQIEIGPSKAQVALIQYSDKPTTNFLLNTYSLKTDILSEMSNIQLKGGTSINTGQALDYVKNNVFIASSGSRAQEGVPQVLILLSGAKSEDNVLVPLERLKDAGIVLFSVGINNADKFEMQRLAHSPTEAFFIEAISDFPLVRQQLLSVAASHKGRISPGIGE